MWCGGVGNAEAGREKRGGGELPLDNGNLVFSLHSECVVEKSIGLILLHFLGDFGNESSDLVWLDGTQVPVVRAEDHLVKLVWLGIDDCGHVDLRHDSIIG